MATSYEIPLQASAQKFSIQLAGVVYNLNLHWCAPNASWVIDIADINDNPLVSGIPLITGVDLLAQYDYLGFGGELVCQTDNATYAVPTYANLGSGSHLFFLTNP